jgi:hypothetical protein
MKKLIFLILMLLICTCATAPKEPVTYSVSPATAEEQAVSNTVETMITSFIAQDIEKHLSCYAPDATIDSKLAGGIITLDEYRQMLQKMDRLPGIRLKNTKIGKVSNDKYWVESVLSIPRRANFSILYNLVPVEGRWVIIRQRYK